MIEIRHDQAKPVHHEPKNGMVATSATLTLLSPSGSTIETPAVTKPTATGSVQTGTTALTVQLAAGEAAAFEVGERVKIVSDGVTYLPTIARINGDALILRAKLPEVPDVGAAVAKIRMTATISAPGIAQLSTDCRLEWVFSDGSISDYHTEGVSIVRWPWVSPVSADDVRDHLAEVYSDDSRSDAFCAAIADRASDKIAQALRSSGRRAHLFPDPAILTDPTWQAVRLLLAEQGYVPEGDATAFAREMRFALQDSLATVVKSLSGYDADGDGAISDDEKRGHVWAFKVSR